MKTAQRKSQPKKSGPLLTTVSKHFASIFPILGVVFFVSLRFLAPTWYYFLIQEDSWLETIQAIGFGLAAAIFAGLTTLKLPQIHNWIKLYWLAWAIALLLIFGEEISWGQRLLNFHSPRYFATNNVQTETTIHNLSGLQHATEWSYVLLGLGLTLGWLFLPIITPLFESILLRILPRKTNPIEIKKTLQFLVPPSYLAFYFLPVAGVYVLLLRYQLYGIVMPDGYPLMTGRDQEIGEVFLALGLLLFGIWCWKLVSLQTKKITHDKK